MKNENQPEKSKLPVIALGLEGGSVAVFFLGVMAFASGFLALLGILLIIFAFAMPVIGIVLAIFALCLGKANIGNSGVAMSVIAIVLPIVAIIVTIILFSTGVAYIRFM